jgi:hypothetical protein
VLGIGLGQAKNKIEMNKAADKQADEVNKFREFFGILNYWLTLKEEGKGLEKFFFDHGYHKIAIYGMKDLGIHLREELRDSSVRVCYGIDKNADCIYTDIEMFSTLAELPEADVIVVTPVHYFDEIKRELGEYTEIPVISLADVLKEV